MQIDISSLLDFKRSIISNPYHTLDNWNPAIMHVCNSTGISFTLGIYRVNKINMVGSGLVACIMCVVLENLSGL
jgi:hypothetical protein